MSDLEQRIVAIVAGYSFALVGGYLYLTRIVDLIWGFDQAHTPHHLPRISRLVGLVERALYVTALLMGYPEFIALWLVLRIAMDWKLERHWGEAPHLAYGVMFVGSGTSLLYAAVGFVIIQLGINNDWLGIESGWMVWLVATGSAGLLLIASEGLRQLLIHQAEGLQRAPGPEAPASAPVAVVAASGFEIETNHVDSTAAVAEEVESPLPVVTIPAAPPLRVRRSSEEIERQAEEVRAVIRAEPGQGIAEIADALGASTTELRRPVQLLIEGRMLRKVGEGRMTQYFPGLSRRKKVGRVSTSSPKKKVSRKTSKKKATRKKKRR